MKILAILGLFYSIFAVASPAFASQQRDSTSTRKRSPSLTTQTQHCSETTLKENPLLETKRNFEFLESKVACHDHNAHARSSIQDWEGNFRNKDEKIRPRNFSNRQKNV